MEKVLVTIGELLIRLIAAAGALGLSYINGKYFLLGVEASRGYEAVGGEVIFLCIVFVALYIMLLKGIEFVIHDVADTFRNFD